MVIITGMSGIVRDAVHAALRVFRHAEDFPHLFIEFQPAPTPFRAQRNDGLRAVLPHPRQFRAADKSAVGVRGDVACVRLRCDGRFRRRRVGDVVVVGQTDGNLNGYLRPQRSLCLRLDALPESRESGESRRQIRSTDSCGDCRAQDNADGFRGGGKVQTAHAFRDA